MKGGWSARMVSDAVWELRHPTFGASPVGEVLWARVLSRPASTMDRIVAGLNGPSMRPRTVTGPWRVRPVEGQARFELWWERPAPRRPGLAGEIGWLVPLVNGWWLAEAAAGGLNGWYERVDLDQVVAQAVAQ